MKTFSQRKGLAPITSIVQVESINDDLRNSLWNALDYHIWSVNGFMRVSHGQPEIEVFSRGLWSHFFKLPMDERPDERYKILAEIREHFFSCSWNEVYDFVEWVVSFYGDSKPKFVPYLNRILERELAGYRIVDGNIVDIIDKQEVEMLEATLQDDRFAGVAAHLKQALEHLASREKPDYRNSIKESISAVEGMARIVTKDPKATLGDALKALEKDHKLHPALKEGFSKLYGYTSDEQGIRHAMLDEPELDAADAKFP